MVFLVFKKLPIASLSGDYKIIRKKHVGSGIRQDGRNVDLPELGSSTFNYADNVCLCHFLGTNYSFFWKENVPKGRVFEIQLLDQRPQTQGIKL